MNATYWDNTQLANFRGSPLNEATKQHKQKLNGEKWDVELEHLSALG